MIGSLIPYPSYRSSGIGYLGDVPAHWDVRRLCTVAELRVSNVDKHTKESEVPVRLCNYVDVYKNDRITSAMPFMSATASMDEIERFRLNKNDVLITKDSETWEDIGVPAWVVESADDLLSGYHLAILRPHKEILGSYLALACGSKAIAHQFSVRANGVTRYGLTRFDIRSILLPLPPYLEQKAIVHHHDYVVTRIHKTDKCQERFIELLEEERYSIINQAVTRGLDPSVQLKPSGIQRFVDVPAHWEVCKLKQKVKINDATLPETTDPYFEFSYIDIGSVDHGRLSEQPQKLQFYASPSRARRIVENGDTIVSTVRTYLKATWFAENITNVICSTGFAVLTPGRDLSPKFVSYVAQSNVFTDQVTADSVGVAYPAISDTKLGSLVLCVPPLAEQVAIVEYLDKVTAGIDAAIARARRQIELLQEYRTRLIADVVTGKLDVREAVAQLPEDGDEIELIEDVREGQDPVVHDVDLSGIM